MDRIGVRELRHNTTAYLRRVKAGETIEITDRGVPVAQLIPARPSGGRDRLIAEGRLRPGTGRLLEHLDPLPSVPDQRPLSVVLDEIREERLR